MTTRMRIATTLAMMLGALAGNDHLPSFNDRPDPRGPRPKTENGRTFWPKRSKQGWPGGTAPGTYNAGRNAQKRARRRLERHLRADAVARSGGVHTPKHRSAY